MNETTVKSKKTTKICLKCGRGLYFNQDKCSSCGCEDIMNKKEYNKLIDEYERADNNKKLKMRNNLNYVVFFKYKYIQNEKAIQQNHSQNKEGLYDTLKIIGSLALLIIGVILWIYLTIHLSAIIGLLIFACFVLLGSTIFNNISNKTKKEIEQINKTQKEQKEHQELHGGYKCPNCDEHAGHEISTMKKVISVGTLGLASDKIGKNYECKNCGYKW